MRILFSGRFEVTVEDLREQAKPRWGERNDSLKYMADYCDGSADNLEYVEKLLRDESAEYRRFIDSLRPLGLRPENIVQSDLKRRLLSSVADPDRDGMFPVVLYMSVTGDDRDSIGLLFERGKEVRVFESNEEASEATVALANRVLNGGRPRPVKVWGSHGAKVVEHIREAMALPKGLYVSPKKSYASGYFGADRVLFCCVVDANGLSQESEYDWKVIDDGLKIQKLMVF